MKKARLTIEELRTLELPVTLECDDGYFTNYMKKITVKYVGEKYAFVSFSNNVEELIGETILGHFPSPKPEPRTVVFRQWIDKDLEVMCIMVSDKGYTINGDKHLLFDGFLKWIGEEHHIEVPSDWRGEN